IFIFLTGISLDRHVKVAIEDSGVETGSHLYSLYPKMCELLLNSKSDNTVKSYFYAFRRWEKFITEHGQDALPAQPVHVALYLTNLLNNGSTSHPVSNAVYGIKWAHEVSGLPDPTINSFVTSIVEASKRTTTKTSNKKDPVSAEILIELCTHFKDSDDLLIIRDLTMILLSFSGFLRYDEISSLRFKDVVIHDNYLILYINKSKTDQYRQGNEILISKGLSIACPYVMFIRYLELIGLHSFRAGGATAAANANVNERCLKKHGRWKSDSSKDRYIVDSTEKRLQVSKELGL
ncbi:integrase/recombinase xerD homolog, partial [Mytilus californianus]|uniref:integrase/recombinase xerD homolog n=1 Tax=Mytilus californianus TaxID=6549 RepID=UPI00224502AA